MDLIFNHIARSIDYSLDPTFQSGVFTVTANNIIINETLMDAQLIINY
jgi:hypothetical protein